MQRGKIWQKKELTGEVKEAQLSILITPSKKVISYKHKEAI